MSILGGGTLWLQTSNLIKLLTTAWIHRFPFYSVGYEPPLSFILKLTVSNLPRESSFKVTFLYFGHIPILLWPSPSFWLQSVAGLSCTFPASILKLAVSPRSPNSLKQEKIFRKELGTGYIHYHWGVIVSRPYEWTKLGNLCPYNLFTFSYTHLYLFLCLSIYIQNQGFIQIEPNPIQVHRV